MNSGIDIREAEENSNALFSISGIDFVPCEEKKNLIQYSFNLGLKMYEAIDVRTFFADTTNDWTFPLEAPAYLSTLIEKYEENKNPNEVVLFHDFRTKYIDILEFVDKENVPLLESMVFVGFTCMSDSVCFSVKAASGKTLELFLEQIEKKCISERIERQFESDIKWKKLQEYKLDTAENTRTFQQDQFLRTTIKYFGNFYKIFRKIDDTGYLSQNIYEMYTVCNTNPKDKTKSTPLNKVRKYLMPYWVYDLPLRKGAASVLCLHTDPEVSGKDILKVVYAFPPMIMQYYVQHWFEDITEYMINESTWNTFTVLNIECGRTYNFYKNGNDANSREIDVAVLLQKEGVSKLIGIECKKTMTKNESYDTKKKWKDKVLASGNNPFDSFIHLGCFPDDEIEYDKQTLNGQKYKQSVISVENDTIYDVPYFAFCIRTLEEFKEIFSHVIDEIFDQW